MLHARIFVSILCMLVIVMVGRTQPIAPLDTPNIAIVEQPLPAYCDGLARSEARPHLRGVVEFRDTLLYRVHYVLIGEDAAMPGTLDMVTQALDDSLTWQIDRMGWAFPPADCGEGGDARLDVYIMDLTGRGQAGYAQPDVVIGDHPQTPAIELRGAYGHLVIDNDLLARGNADGVLLRTTVAHELHHVVQFGYDVGNSFFGLYEAGATWIETQVYPHISSSIDYIEDVFARPDWCLGTRATNDFRIYGEWLLIDSIAQDHGFDSYRRIWEGFALEQGLAGFYAGLARLGTTPQDVLERYAIRNLLRHYAFLIDIPHVVTLAMPVTHTGRHAPLEGGVQPLAVDYVSFDLRGRYAVQIEAEEPLSMVLVGINRNEAMARVHEIGRGGVIDTTSYDRAYLLVLNPQQHTDHNACRHASWALSVEAGDAPPISPTAERWDASRFVAPD